MKEPAPGTASSMRTRPFPFLVLALSLLFTCGVTYYLAKVNRTKNLARFTNVTLEVESRIRDSLNTHVALLRGGTGLFAASEEVTREEFRQYFERLRTEQFYPGLFGFGYAQRVRDGDVAMMEKQMRESSMPDFEIWPEGKRDDYFPIIFLEPMNWRNQRAIGYDMFSEPVRQAAMSRAARLGFALSGKVRLVQETETDEQPGFLLYVGDYEGGEFPESEAERIERLQGFVYSPFRARDLFLGIFRGDQGLRTGLEVYDGTEIRDENELYRSKNPSDGKSLFVTVNTFPFAGHNWTIIHRTTPEYEATLERANVFWVFVAGISVSLLLFGVTLVLAQARQRAELSESELLQERELLRASEDLHRTIAETAADAIITIDENSQIITVNRAAERIFGYTVDEMLGQSITMLMPERMRPRHRHGMSRFISTGEKGIPWEGIELPGQHKKGHEIPLEISFGEMHKKGKRIFTGIIRDITERKKAEEQIRTLNRDLERRVAERTSELQETNSQMESFIYSIAHDLRAPLRAMRGFAQALREDYASHLDHQAQDYCSRIVSSAKFMDDLINDLLSFSRLTRTELELSPVNLEAIIVQVREVLAEEIAEKKAVIEIIPPLPDVMAHEATLRQVITNLVSNSLKFVAPGTVPKISISASNAEDRARISVEDNGIGISEQYRDRIFGIFERLHGGAYPGTGIGLAIVRKGVERMNGRVGFRSTVGQGSCFWFELPRAD